MSVQFRPFRNTDPPGLVRVWNEGLSSRGGAFLQGTTPLESHVFAKLYFDPQGLIVAAGAGGPVGFVHAGFGPGEGGIGINPAQGVICALVVHPEHRRRGIGTELFRRAIDYLRRAGAGRIYVGAMRPLVPFYWGIYGGSELPGVLSSETGAGSFLERRGGIAWDRCHVLQRDLEGPIQASDGRFAALRRKYEFHVGSRPAGKRWYDEVAQAPLEIIQFELAEKHTGIVAATARAWDMDLFDWRWHQPSAGVMDVEVREALRGQGLGKFLMVQVLSYLQEQFFTLIEIQTMERNLAALRLYEGLGFRRVDQGTVYRVADPEEA